MADDSNEPATNTPGVVITSDVQVEFLRLLASHGNVTKAAEVAGHSRVTFYRHRNAKDDAGEYTEPEFRAAWDDALEEASDGLRFEARRRAVDGVLEPVFFRGSECGEVRKYSDTLLARLLAAHCPEHKDVKLINLQTQPGESVKVDVADAPGRARRIAELLSQLEPEEPTDGDAGDE